MVQPMLIVHSSQLTCIKNLSDLVPVLPGLVTNGWRIILRGTVARGLTMVVLGTTLNLWGAVVLTLIRMDKFTKFFTKTVALVSLVEYPSKTRVFAGEHRNISSLGILKTFIYKLQDKWQVWRGCSRNQLICTELSPVWNQQNVTNVILAYQHQKISILGWHRMVQPWSWDIRNGP